MSLIKTYDLKSKGYCGYALNIYTWLFVLSFIVTFFLTQMSIKISPNKFLFYELHVIWNICFAILQYQSITNENIWFEIDVVLKICVEYLYLALCTSFHRKISPLSVPSHCKQRRGIAPINSIFRSLNISQKK